MLLLEAGPRDQGGGYYPSSPDLPHPDIQLYFSPLSYEGPGRPRQRALMSPDAFSGFNSGISPCKAKSAGHLELRSPDWRDPPAIHPNYLDDPHDMAQMLGGPRFLRRLAASAALSAAIKVELKPGAAAQSDEALTADIRARAYSVFHPIGTCRMMGPDAATAAVDARLRVHGLDALRIASTSGNTNAPAIMVGDRAAGFILADARASR